MNEDMKAKLADAAIYLNYLTKKAESTQLGDDVAFVLAIIRGESLELVTSGSQLKVADAVLGLTLQLTPEVQISTRERGQQVISTDALNEVGKKEMIRLNDAVLSLRTLLEGHEDFKEGIDLVVESLIALNKKES